MYLRHAYSFQEISITAYIYFTKRYDSYDVNKLYENLTVTEKKDIFIHSVTGCES